jgi:adenosyl cobinamide kinase/adenosyl cobinamide phosphate guanylyltransferase
MAESLQDRGRFDLSNMKELILILGGARAGKSTFALKTAAAISERVCFVATAEALDEEMQARIQTHRAERPIGWSTVEEPRDLGMALQQTGDVDVVIVDCLTLFVSNWMMTQSNLEEMNSTVTYAINDFLETVSTGDQTVICVSNEVGLGLVPDNELGRAYRDTLGRVNQLVAAAADRVYLVVAGLPLQIKP